MMNETDVLGGSKRWLRRTVVSLLYMAIVGHVLAAPVINEINYHPAPVEDNQPEPVNLEFIELYNPSEEPIDLSGYAFTRGIGYEFGDGVEILPDSYLVVASDPEALGGLFPELLAEHVFGPWTGTLSNSGEQIRLVDATGETVDRVTYADQGDWAVRREASDNGNFRGWVWETRADGEGRSLELLDPHLTNNLGQNWNFSHDVGTPGAENSRGFEDLPPMIRKVAHSPAVPTATEEVSVRAEIVDATMDEVSVSLHWRNSQNVDAGFEVVPMMLEEEGGSRYVAVIPPQDDQVVVEFYVRAEDARRARSWPAPTTVPSIFSPGSQGANALYQVDNATVSHGASYRLILSTPERQTFDSLTRTRDDLMNATLITELGGEIEVRYLCGVRFRGNSSRTSNPPPKRVNLPRDQPLHGETSINLNSRSPHNQLVGNMLFTAAGLVAPQARLVQVSENGRDPESHVHILPYGSEFVDAHFPDEQMGNLYRKRSASGNRNVKRWGVHSLSSKAYERDRWYVDDSWDKATNGSAADWSDLQRFVETMDLATEEDYVSQVREVLVPEQWLRWFAVMTMLGNTETNLSNGIDDDYAMIADDAGRFLLLPHDLDSLFGFGAEAGLFPMIDPSIGTFESRIPQLEPFFEEPEFLSGYYSELERLIETVFAKAQFDRLVRGALAGTPLSNRASSMISFMDQRREFVRGRLSEPFVVDENSVPVESRAETLTISGNAGLARIARIEVNGTEAEFDRENNTWRVRSVPLNVGVNVIVIRSFDVDGNVLETIQRQVNRPNTLPLSVIGGVLEEATVLTAEGGPYRIAEDLIVPPDVLLKIEAGTSVYPRAGVKIVVQGQILAEGQADGRIYLGPDPSERLVADFHASLPMTLPKWGGIETVENADVQNVLEFVDLAHAQSPEGSVRIGQDTVLRGVRIEGSRMKLIDVDAEVVRIEDCHFPDRFEATDDLEALGEVSNTGLITCHGLLTLERSTFGYHRGTSDVIEIIGTKTSVLRDNVFVGSERGIISSKTFLYLTGNTFQDCGITVSADGSLLATFNRFLNVQQAVVGRGKLAVFEQNTVVGASGVVFDGQQGSLYDNLFWEIPNGIGVTDGEALFTDNVLPAALAETLTLAQTENNLLVTDPQFLDDDGRLAAHALARRAGRFAHEVGAYGPREPQVHVQVSGTSARIVVGGGGFGELADCVDDQCNRFSFPHLETRLYERVERDLSLGIHEFSSEWSDVLRRPEGMVSAPFTVTGWDAPIVLEEILVRNQSSVLVGDRYPDVIELRNTSNQPWDLSSYTIRDGSVDGDVYTFPEGVSLAGGDSLVLYGGDPAVGADPGLPWLGFSFSEGESVVLTDESGNVLVEQQLGLQLADQSLNRRVDGSYVVATPSLGHSRGEPLLLGDPKAVVLNEWLVAPQVSFQEDYIELFNPLSLPVDLGGFRLTDDPTGTREAFVFPSPTLLGPGGFLVMTSDDLPFGLGGSGDWIVFQDSSARVIDSVFVAGLQADQAMGRFPDGGSEVVVLDLGTPGIVNYRRPDQPQDGEFLVPVNFDTLFRYHEGDPGVGDAWRLPDFDDANWEEGAGIFASDEVFEGQPFTPFSMGPPRVHYFRVPFNVEGRREFIDGQLFLLASAGAVAYLNGVEIARVRLPAGQITAETLATGTSEFPDWASTPVAGVELLDGENWLTVAFHQPLKTAWMRIPGSFSMDRRSV